MKKSTGTWLLGYLLSGNLLFSAGMPVEAQQYHSSYGGGRVTKQSQIGLYRSEPTYVGSGTIGQSARDGGRHKAGLQTGGLPNTNWSEHVRKPGDDMYNGNNGAMRDDKGALIYADQVKSNGQGRAQRRPQQMMQQRQSQQRSLYQPGSNGGAANYGSGTSSGSGVAKYGSYTK